MSDKLQYLGWGLVGTPKGRQQTADGADKQLNLAASFDLEQQFGGCLPDPKTRDMTPLYRVSFQKKGQYAVLGVAEYRPIYEQGQTRAGTYFGAFIEAVHHRFDENQSALLSNVLLALSSYQTKHLINPETASYKEMLNGRTFDAPTEPLSQIAAQMRPLATDMLTQTSSEEALYIECAPQQAVDALKLLLQQQLYYCFNQIFFSESAHISQQMQNKKIPYLTFSQLNAGRFHLNGWEKEVRYLRGIIQQNQHEQQQLAMQLKQEREQQNQMVEAQLKHKMGEVNQQIDQYRQAAEYAENRASQNEKAAQFGSQIYQLISQHANHLGNGELAKYATTNPLATEIGNLRATLNDVRAHLSNLSQQANQETQVITKTSVWTYLFGGLSVLFGGILLAMSVMSLFSDEKSISKQEYEDLQNVKNAHIQKQQQLNNEIADLKKQLEEAREKFSQTNNELAKWQTELNKMCKEIRSDRKFELCKK